MQSKQIIIIIVIITALAGAGVFAYMSFSKSSIEIEITESTTNNRVLPNGNKLDFNVIDEFNPTGKEFQYPRVNASEIGLPLNSIVQ